MKIRALNVSVYKFPHGDCTNRGVSSKYDSLLVACPDGPYEIDTELGIPENFCFVRCRNLFGDEKVFSIVPADVTDDGEICERGGKWYMMGGNYAATSDSRFSKMVDGMYGAVPIHDRVE